MQLPWIWNHPPPIVSRLSCYVFFICMSLIGENQSNAFCMQKFRGNGGTRRDENDEETNFNNNKRVISSTTPRFQNNDVDMF